MIITNENKSVLIKRLNELLKYVHVNVKKVFDGIILHIFEKYLIFHCSQRQR